MQQKYLCKISKILGVCNLHTRFKKQTFYSSKNYTNFSNTDQTCREKVYIKNTEMNRPYPQSNIGTPYWKTSSTMRPGCIIHLWEGPLTQQKVRKPKCGKPLKISRPHYEPTILFNCGMDRNLKQVTLRKRSTI